MLSNYTILIILIIGLFAGTVSGLLGVGGGIIVVPSLVLIMGFSQHLAQGTNIAMMMAPVVVLSFVNYYKAGQVDWKVALVLMTAFIVGGWIGSKISLQISPVMLRKVFGFFMLIVALKMIIGK